MGISSVVAQTSAGTNTTIWVLTDRRPCAGSAPGGRFVFPTGQMVEGFGYRWGWQWAGGMLYHSAFTTILPPNAPACYNRLDSFNAIATPSSMHTGGVNASLMDGSVRFITENIDSGTENAHANPAAPSGRSPFGVWGNLGARASGGTVSL